MNKKKSSPLFLAKRAVGGIIKYAFLIVLCAVFLLPLLWMISTSLKPNAGLLVFPIEWIPKEPMWENYVKVFQIVKFGTYIKNTLITSLTPVLGVLIATPMVAYSITMIPWKGVTVLDDVLMTEV